MSVNEPSIIYNFDPRDLPPEFLCAIGLVAAASAQTEHVLGKFIGALLGIDNIQALALTSHMTNPLRKDIICTLAELDTPSINMLDEVDDLMDAIEDAFRRRNLILHNSFMTHPETKEVFSHRLRARGSLVLTLKPISVNEMKQDAALIYKAGIDIVNFMIRSNISPCDRIQPLRESIDRNKKARTERRKNGI